MALLPPPVTGLLLANLVGHTILGISSAQLAIAVSSGFCSYMVSAPVITTADVGTLGAGSGIGFGLVVPPPSLSLSLRSAFEAHSIRGSNRDMLVEALAGALSQALLLAQIVTLDAGTAVGTGTVVSVIPVPLVSIPMMIASFIGSGLIGVASANLASAIAQGVDQALPQARGQTVIAGPSSPLPGGGIGLGRCA